MTLYRRLNKAVPKKHNQNVDIEVIGPPSQLTSMAKRVYVHLEIIVSHMPIFLFLQQNNVVVPQNDYQAQEEIIENLQHLFPIVVKQCGSCGILISDYRHHLQVMVSIDQVGGKNLRNIRLNGLFECFDYYTPDTGKWTSIKTSDDLKKLAGFILPPEKGQKSRRT